MRREPLVLGHEELADRVAAGLRQREAELVAFLLEERVRNLNEDSGAVAGQRICTHGAAVLEIAQHAERVSDDLVRFLSREVGDEAYAARVALERRIKETLSFRTLNDGLLWRVVVHLSTSGAWRRNVREIAGRLLGVLSGAFARAWAACLLRW